MPAHKKEKKKEAIGLRLYAEHAERLRNAVFWIGQALTVQGIIEKAALEALTKLEKEHNNGKPFPQRTAPIAKGQKL